MSFQLRYFSIYVDPDPDPEPDSKNSRIQSGSGSGLLDLDPPMTAHPFYLHTSSTRHSSAEAKTEALAESEVLAVLRLVRSPSTTGLVRTH